MNRSASFVSVFWILVLGCALVRPWTLSAQQGMPDLDYFPPSSYLSPDYPSGPQVFDAVRDSRGMLYISTAYNLLEFDGHEWSQVPGAEQITAANFVKNEEGMIFAGGFENLGYLEPDSSGTMRFISLRDQVQEDAGHFLKILDVFCHRNKVYFLRGRDLLVWDYHSMVQIKAPEYISTFMQVDGKLFLRDFKAGLIELQSDSIVPFPGGKAFQDIQARGFFPHPDGGWLVLTAQKGLYRYHSGTLKPIDGPVSDFLQSTRTFDWAQLPNGDIALPTMGSGLLVISPEGKWRRLYNRSNGFPTDAHIRMYRDPYGYGWIAGNDGLIRINVDGESSLLNEDDGLPGITKVILPEADSMLIGTYSGLFRLNRQPLAGSSAKFAPVAEVQEEVNDLAMKNDTLLVAAYSGLYAAKAGKWQKMIPSICIQVLVSRRYPGRCYLLNSRNLMALEGERLIPLPVTFKNSLNAQKMAEAPNGDIWLRDDRLVCLRTQSGPEWLKDSIWVDSTHGLRPEMGEIQLVKYQEHLLFASLDGLYRWDDAQAVLVRADELGPQLSRRPMHFLKFFGPDQAWLETPGGAGRVQRAASGIWRWDQELMKGRASQFTYDVHRESADVYWLATNKGAERVDFAARGDFSCPIAPILRSVVTSADSILPLAAVGGTVPRLSALGNGIEFKYSAPIFEHQEAVQYSSRLLGFEEKWSSWTDRRIRTFTNLPGGDYVFEVKARNIYGQESPQKQYAFSVATPWYLQVAAFIMYGLLLLGLTLLAVRWRTHRLLQAKERLENTVRERTAEISAQKIEIEQEKLKSDALLLNILPAAVAQELKDKGKTTPRQFDQVSILFSDIVGFTAFAEKRSPAELVRDLDRYFGAVDAIIGKHGLEKVKTIGDAYMCAGGLDGHGPGIHRKMLCASLEMVDLVESLKSQGLEFDIRIGIHTGPLVAGVVGTKKFAYDIWGDAVNIAARMESSGAPGRVNVSQATKDMVGDAYQFEARGSINAKNMGEMKMYFVVK